MGKGGGKRKCLLVGLRGDRGIVIILWEKEGGKGETGKKEKQWTAIKGEENLWMGIEKREE